MLPRSLLHLACALLPAVLSACSEGVTAIGPSSQVSLFTSLERTDPVLAPLVRSFEREVRTTHRERAFQVEITPVEHFDRQRRFRNVVLVAPLAANDAAGTIIRRLVGERVHRELETGERPFAIYSDVFAIGQTVIVIAASSRDGVRNTIERHSDALYDSLEQRVRRGLGKSLYLRGERVLPRDGEWGWRIRVPREYEVEDDPARALSIAHALSPERWLFISSAPMLPEDFSAEAAIARRRSVHRLYADEMLVEEDLSVERTAFAGCDAYRFSGRWQSPSLTVGGPFRLYAFHSRSRLYLVELLVFLPGLDKLPYLRQLEAIAATFELSEGAS